MQNHIHLPDDLIQSFSVLAWIFILVADPRGSNSSVNLGTLLNILCSVVQIIGDLKARGELELVEERYKAACIVEEFADWDRPHDNCTVSDAITTEYATIFLSSQRGLPAHMMR